MIYYATIDNHSKGAKPRQIKISQLKQAKINGLPSLLHDPVKIKLEIACKTYEADLQECATYAWIPDKMQEPSAGSRKTSLADIFDGLGWKLRDRLILIKVEYEDGVKFVVTFDAHGPVKSD